MGANLVGGIFRFGIGLPDALQVLFPDFEHRVVGPVRAPPIRRIITVAKNASPDTQFFTVSRAVL